MSLGSSSALPALIIQLEADANHESAREKVSQLAESGLTSLGTVSGLPGRATGWLALARPGLDRVDVLYRPADMLAAFFGGPCAVTAEWREHATRIGHCLLIAGRIGLGDTDDGADAGQLVRTAGGLGLAAGGLVPFCQSPRESRPGPGYWPGTVRYEASARSATAGSALGFSIDLATTGEIGQVVADLRAQAREMSPELLRQRLAVELMIRGQMLPPCLTDRVVEDIMLAGRGDWLGRIARGWRTAVAGNWVLARSIAAIALRRPLPHWHILGTHLVRTSEYGQWLDVAVEPWAAELLAVGQPDEIDVVVGWAERGPGRADRERVAVYRGDYQVGLLGENVDAVYRRMLQEPRHARTDLVTRAIRSRTDAGQWQLQLGYPSRPQRSRDPLRTGASALPG